MLLAGSDAAAGAPEVDVEAGAEAVASGFAEFDEGEGAGAEGGFVEAFGHQEDFVGGGVEFLGEGFDFGEVVFGLDDEFELVVVVLSELAEGGEVDAGVFVADGPLGVPLPGGGVGEFGGDGHEVADDGGGDGAGGFDGDVEAAGVEGVGEFRELGLDEGFAAGEDDVAEGGVGGGPIEEAVEGPVFTFGIPGGVGGIAPVAAEITAGGADEEGGDAGEEALALDGGEDFADFHGVSGG